MAYIYEVYRTCARRKKASAEKKPRVGRFFNSSVLYEEKKKDEMDKVYASSGLLAPKSSRILWSKGSTDTIRHNLVRKMWVRFPSDESGFDFVGDVFDSRRWKREGASDKKKIMLDWVCSTTVDAVREC